MSDRPTLKMAKTDWQELVLVCQKCSRKVDGGFGDNGLKSLDKVLKRAFKSGTGWFGKGRRAKVKVVKSPCLNICPKNAVTVVKGHAPRSVFVVPVGMEVDAVVEALGLRDGDAPA